jgi:hypothetical protein
MIFISAGCFTFRLGVISELYNLLTSLLIKGLFTTIEADVGQLPFSKKRKEIQSKNWIKHEQ